MNSISIAQRPVSAAMFGDVVRVFLDFVAGVGHSDRKSAIPHHRQVNYVVADEACFSGCEFFLRQNFAEGTQLVLNPLTNVIELKIARAHRHGFRSTLGDQAGLDPGHARQGNSNSIVRVKAFDLDRSLAGEIDSTGLAAGIHCAAVGRKNSLPSVITPSTSKSKSLIFLARDLGSGMGGF